MTSSLRKALRTNPPVKYPAPSTQVTYGPEDIKPETPHPERRSRYPLWTMKDGTVLRLEDMNLRHLRNSRAMVARKIPQIRAESSYAYANPFDSDTEAYWCFEAESDYDPAEEFEHLVACFDREITVRDERAKKVKR